MHNEVSPGLLSQLRKHWAQSDMVKPHICRLTAVKAILQDLGLKWTKMLLWLVAPVKNATRQMF